jgi:hypothetical protein
MPRISALVLALLSIGICEGCSTVAHAPQAHVVANSLGFEGCRAFGPLTPVQVVESDKKARNYLSSRRHPDWDALIAHYVSGDLIYYIYCTTVAASKIVVGSDFYALTRGHVVIARALETIYD